MLPCAPFRSLPKGWRGEEPPWAQPPPPPLTTSPTALLSLARSPLAYPLLSISIPPPPRLPLSLSLSNPSPSLRNLQDAGEGVGVGADGADDVWPGEAGDEAREGVGGEAVHAAAAVEGADLEDVLAGELRVGGVAADPGVLEGLMVAEAHVGIEDDEALDEVGGVGADAREVGLVEAVGAGEDLVAVLPVRLVARLPEGRDACDGDSQRGGRDRWLRAAAPGGGLYQRAECRG
jgi:hypothetical protein